MDICRPMYVRIFILLFVLLSCDSEVRVNLTAVVGSSVTFSDPVKERGILMFGSNLIASVSNGAFALEEDIYSNRLNWSSSGLFTLSDLQKNDSGVYNINSKKGTVFTKLYDLKLYDPVSAPVVSCVNVSKDSLSLQCSVNQTEQTTLRWFREEQPVDTSHSGVITVHRQDYDNSQYRCVAQNPADTKTTNVNIAKVCGINDTRSGRKEKETTSNYAHYIIIPVALVLLLLCFVIFMKKKCFEKKSTPPQTQDSVVYAQINHDKRSVIQSRDTLNPSGTSAARPGLTTVYDKIQQRRMTPTYSNCAEEIT